MGVPVKLSESKLLLNSSLSLTDASLFSQLVKQAMFEKLFPDHSNVSEGKSARYVPYYATDIKLLRCSTPCTTAVISV